jgi:hypothetical protein
MADPKADAVAKTKSKKTKTVKKIVTKKTAVKKADLHKPKPVSAKIKKAVKAKVKATKPKVTKVAKPKITKAAKATKSKGSSEFSKFETYAIEAIALLATDEKPCISAAKVRQYVVDYDDKALVSQIPKYTKRALELLVAKKILKAKKDSYAFTVKGKASAPDKVQTRKKVVRAVKAAPKKAKDLPRNSQSRSPAGHRARSHPQRKHAWLR